MIRPRIRIRPDSVFAHIAPRRCEHQRFASSRAPAKATAPPAAPKPRRFRYSYIWYGALLFGGITVGGAVKNFTSPALPVPGSREDEVTLKALDADVEKLDIVKYMRAQCPTPESDQEATVEAVEADTPKEWRELDIKTHIAESKDEVKGTRTITEQTLAGSKGLGVQRAFWNAETKELVAVIWIGTALSGWPMLAHGGAIATIFTDCMSRMVAGPDASLDTVEPPTSISVTYAKPTYSTNFYILRANYTQPLLPPSAPPQDPNPAPAKSWLPYWKDLTKKDQPTESKKTVELIGTLEDVDGELLVRVKGTFPAPL